MTQTGPPTQAAGTGTRRARYLEKIVMDYRLRFAKDRAMLVTGVA
ncbi:hypothetical protein SFMTTN_3067 [Sulfuriferula multivorans]|uniref:Uncharacterized protein n=1 Tax=Sulfuriferula multivorans TaxID=1559896 RepID=A0A401K0S3_9PROT|nr:hypothetical protein SFMTTN_3067 [Sulfuriferula multivorans]